MTKVEWDCPSCNADNTLDIPNDVAVVSKVQKSQCKACMATTDVTIEYKPVVADVVVMDINPPSQDYYELKKSNKNNDDEGSICESCV